MSLNDQTDPATLTTVPATVAVRTCALSESADYRGPARRWTVRPTVDSAGNLLKRKCFRLPPGRPLLAAVVLRLNSPILVPTIRLPIITVRRLGEAKSAVAALTGARHEYEVSAERV